MHNVIKNDSTKFSRVLKANDLLILEGVDKYKKNVEDEAKQLLEQTKLKCQQMETELLQENQEKLEQQIHELFNYTATQLNKIFNQITEDLYTIIYKVLNKLGFENIDHKCITNIVKSELLNMVEVDQIQIKSNTRSQEILQQKLEELNLNIEYKVDNQLTEFECIIETKLCLVKIDISKCKNIITHILEYKNMLSNQP